MGMHATTIRFSPISWSLIEREARREGVSVAQYVREAAVLQAAYRLGRAGESLGSEHERLLEELRRNGG